MATPLVATANEHSFYIVSSDAVSPQIPSQDTTWPPRNSVVAVIIVDLRAVTAKWQPDLLQQPSDDGVDSRHASRLR